MSFSAGPLLWLSNVTNFAQELTTDTSGGTVTIPMNCQLEAVVLVPTVTTDNAVTNATKVDQLKMTYANPPP